MGRAIQSGCRRDQPDGAGAASAGGARIATLFVKIDYLRKGGIEPRSATIACTVAADGQVSVELLKEG